LSNVRMVKQWRLILLMVKVKAVEIEKPSEYQFFVNKGKGGKAPNGYKKIGVIRYMISNMMVVTRVDLWLAAI
jgi:hypothetical protein